MFLDLLHNLQTVIKRRKPHVYLFTKLKQLTRQIKAGFCKDTFPWVYSRKDHLSNPVQTTVITKKQNILNLNYQTYGYCRLIKSCFLL